MVIHAPVLVLRRWLDAIDEVRRGTRHRVKQELRALAVVHRDVAAVVKQDAESVRGGRGRGPGEPISGVGVTSDITEREIGRSVCMGGGCVACE